MELAGELAVRDHLLRAWEASAPGASVVIPEQTFDLFADLVVSQEAKVRAGRCDILALAASRRAEAQVLAVLLYRADVNAPVEYLFLGFTLPVTIEHPSEATAIAACLFIADTVGKDWTHDEQLAACARLHKAHAEGGLPALRELLYRMLFAS